MALKPGEIVNSRYRIEKQLGQGGFGAVYQAEDTILKVPCALKENLDYWEEAQRQFEREAQMLAGLRHPSLPRVTNYFIIAGQGQYLAMDYVDGFDLQTILERIGQALSEKQVLVWIDQVCDALVYLHSNVPPIIHRDIKPGNIKITSSGLAMLVDFGVAKEYRPDTKTTLGARAVTPGYSPVEQYGNGTTDQRSDQYALGATIYTLLTGRMPPESISRVTGAVLPLPRQINPAISAHVERAILRAMAILASDRFPSVADLREALKKSLASSAPADGAVQARRFPAMPPGFKAGALSDAPAQLKDASLSSPSGLPVSMPVSRPITIKPLPPSRRSAVRVEWVAIPDGEFILGEERKKIHLPAFEMARFPVTNLQYKVFLDAHPKYPAPAHWKDRNIPLGRQRHPVTGVSFFDAQAFCKWLGYRLPSEEEWEKAARGAEWRIYPWGDDWRDGKYCNNRDAHIGSTTPIDRYPDGASVYGVWDLAGNVWEWTSTENQGPNMHILKGGSWREYSGLSVQIGRRRFLTLGDKQDDTGFRCVRLL